MLSGMEPRKSRSPKPARPAATRSGAAEPATVRPGAVTGQAAEGWDWREHAINAALVIVALLVLLAIVGLVLYHSDRIGPGVEAVGVNLGGSRQAKAAVAVQEAWQNQTIAVRAGDISWAVPPSSLGIELDAQAAVAAAYRQSRSWAVFWRWLRGRERVVVSPALRVDRPAAESGLWRFAPELAAAPLDATIRVANGRVEAVPAVPGRELDVAATADWLELSARQVVLQGVLDLQIRALPPAVTDVSALVEQGNRWLSQTLTVRAYDPVQDELLAWAFEPAAWLPWLSLRVDPGAASGLGWRLNEAPLRDSLQARALELGEARTLDLDQAAAAVEQAIAAGSWTARMRVYHAPRLHVVQSGETLSSIARDVGMPYPWLEQANPGISHALSVGQLLTIPSPDALLPLPVVENKRIVVSISRQAMWAYQDGQVRWVWPVSTGIASSPTSPGVFQIQSHDENAYAASWDLWMPYFLGIYRPVPAAAFMNGFHGFPTRDGVSLLWTGNLGAPVTFGCILLDTGNAAALYEWAEEGVIVEILP